MQRESKEEGAEDCWGLRVSFWQDRPDNLGAWTGAVRINAVDGMKLMEMLPQALQKLTV